ncbi:uncharacterized protein LOC129702100 [Leucoraja erinacea]|uniref:uncharacterized protein LOC129702100 n=1 Tax=Leucoraja erinaceus TaxID=7782 RepID=UPI00245884F0|nr:uncharacterized protein LOC129702100 [Leucoraja erinacea]XP_055499641.1 uncharacterized protein LOC129702100 [Leucoraja erinacea]
MVIQKLKKHFFTFGAPVRLQTDNGRQFTSHALKLFANRWNFHHVTSSPEYPQSNGLAERTVRSAKHLTERAHLATSDVYLDLLNLRNIARDGTLGSSAQRLMSRTTRPPIPIAQQKLIPQVLKPATIQKCIQERNTTFRNSRMISPANHSSLYYRAKSFVYKLPCDNPIWVVLLALLKNLNPTLWTMMVPYTAGAANTCLP